MKYAAVVFRNINHTTETVDYGAVADGLLAGGILLGEIVLLPYNDPAAVTSVLSRMKQKCDGVFLICDEVLLPAAREAVSAVLGKEMAGDLLETEDCLFAVLPTGEEGVKLCAEKVVPAVDRRRGQSYHSVVLRTVAAPADVMVSTVTAALDEADGRLEIHMSEEDGAGRVEVVYNRNTPKMVADEVVRILASGLEPYLYAMEDVPIARRLFEALRLHRLRFSCAESFTGGGIAKAIVSNPGASKVFYEGIVAYDSAAKRERLGVSEYTLKTKGAVSEETAYEMAAGLIKGGKCDVAVATTGIAGPASDGSGAPAGLCYIAVGTQERVRVFEYRLQGDRESVTRQAVDLALFLTYREIN